jgi:hypothetical protein
MLGEELRLILPKLKPDTVVEVHENEGELFPILAPKGFLNPASLNFTRRLTSSYPLVVPLYILIF